MSAKDDGNDQAVASLTVRDYFASAALQSILSYGHLNGGPSIKKEYAKLNVTDFADSAYMYADAMLKARLK